MIWTKYGKLKVGARFFLERDRGSFIKTERGYMDAGGFRYALCLNTDVLTTYDGEL